MTQPNCLQLALGLLVAVSLCGCDGGPTTAPSAGSRVSPAGPPPPPPLPGEGGVAPMPAAGPPAAAASGLGSAAFLTANRQVLEATEAILTVLAAVNDEATARDAADKLPALTTRWETEQKAATALFLTLSADQQREAMALGQQEAAARSQSGRQDLIAAIQSLAASPQRPTVEPALVGLRDTLLSQHSIYAPVTFRKRLAEKLGDIGSPLP